MFRQLTIRNLIPLVSVNLSLLTMKIKVVAIKKKFIRKRICFFIDRFPLFLFKQNDIRIVYLIKFEEFFSEPMDSIQWIVSMIKIYLPKIFSRY